MTSTAMIALNAKRRRTGFAHAIQSDGRPARRSHASLSDYRFAIVFESAGH
jgi:hypothetical protein